MGGNSCNEVDGFELNDWNKGLMIVNASTLLEATSNQACLVADSTTKKWWFGAKDLRSSNDIVTRW